MPNLKTTTTRRSLNAYAFSEFFSRSRLRKFTFAERGADQTAMVNTNNKKALHVEAVRKRRIYTPPKAGGLKDCGKPRTKPDRIFS